MDRFKNNRIFFGVLLVIMVLGLSVAGISRTTETKNQNPEKTENEAPIEENEIIVYGIWNQKESVVKGIEISTGKEFIIATIPLNVKKVTILSPEKLLFINKTNEKDHGSEIVLFSPLTNKTETLLTASDGFGIDDYVISPSNQYLSTWEVAFKDDAFRDGKSRVYSFDLNKRGVKNLIYNETANQPVHYPIGISNKGEIFFDTFLPNTESGYANGMSRSDFVGFKKEEILSMKKGTYGSQPSLSPSGDKILFAGYNGIFGDGAKEIEGFKQAVVARNTIEIFDTVKNQRIKLLDQGKDGVYGVPTWDNGSSKITVAAAITKDKSKQGLFLYDLLSKKLERVDTGEKIAGANFLTSLTSGSYLLSKVLDSGNENNISDNPISNLGGSYYDIDTQYFISNIGEIKEINTSDFFMQYIDTVPESLFETFTGIRETNEKNNESKVSGDKKKTLQLQTFYFKTELPKKRVTQQTKERCIDLARQQCIAMGNTSDLTGDPKNLHDCMVAQRKLNYKTKDGDGKRVCSDSPLYLYGEAGQIIDIEIKTPIFNPSYNSGSNFTAILSDNHTFTISGKHYESIDFNYTPASNVKIPETGSIVGKENLSNTLIRYASKLGLNKKETEDLVNYGEKNINSPYVFVSFFDQKKSKQILPISFNPKPDTYINYVFYFKRLKENPNLKIKEPKFEKTERKGFTAVEISGIIE